MTMSRIKLNTIGLNRLSSGHYDLNNVGGERRPVADPGETPDIPSGYEEFMVTEGAFSAKDGEFYVKR